ncbi:hypothetical protein P280DRAFT_465535 [Massarina eburnea CBS 473.64]|uniref:DUF7730 domain-containing protein n=1 Tax=Massarina eburnea CBS 473.64 TaxID=1395130 RepID=A0A6A6SES0_9PLEO|nr:hypothetical protein P280DRAFT_465535 [Massarina eburnea CBS 473.64]
MNNNNKASLFSRTRPGNPSPKKIRGFMALPGEVRNQIYAYYFREDFRCEIAAKESTIDQLALKVPPKTIKLCVGITRGKKPVSNPLEEPILKTQQRSLRVSRPYGNYRRVHGESTKWENSLCALVLVCKQIHLESVVFLYQKTTFVFDAPKRINNFLRWVPLRNLAHVTKLQLCYIPYNGNGWDTKHRLSWTRVCKAFTKKMISLQDLTLYIYTAQSVRWFDLRQHFVQPLLHFRRLSVANPSKGPSNSPASLKMVKVHFSTYWSRTGFTQQPLTDASNHLHRLYGEAIGKAILGKSEDEAMEGFLDAWEGRYAMWKHHLQYNVTGW